VIPGVSCKICLFGLWPAILCAQPSLRITSPVDGTAVTAGTSLTVKVAAVGSFKAVMLDGRGLECPGPRFEPPDEFTVKVPAEGIAAGEHYLTAFGAEIPGQPIYSTAVMLFVERAGNPVRIRIDPW
jgi:hypothetical protein